MVYIIDGKLDIGTWEQIHYGEFDGMREKPQHGGYLEKAIKKGKKARIFLLFIWRNRVILLIARVFYALTLSVSDGGGKLILDGGQP